jgi:DNA-directed RNA polymerase subunit alpha
VTSIRIEGVAHEFSTIDGVKEDVTDIVLNLKDVVCRMHGESDEIEAPLVVTGPTEVKAKDIDLPSGVEILNPNAHIATLEKKAKLEMYLAIGRGRGYRPAEGNKSPARPPRSSSRASRSSPTPAGSRASGSRATARARSGRRSERGPRPTAWRRS